MRQLPCLAAVLVVLVPFSATEHHPSPSGATSSSAAISASSEQSTTAAPVGGDSSGQLRALLLEVRHQLQQPDVRGRQRRRLKARKRRLQEKLRHKRRRRQRQRQHRLLPLPSNSVGSNPPPATVLEQPQSPDQPPAEYTDGAVPTGDTDSEVFPVSNVELGTERLVQTDEDVNNVEHRDRIDMDIGPDISIGTTFDFATEPTDDVGGSSADPAVASEDDTVLTSLWDWLAPREEPQLTTDGGWLDAAVEVDSSPVASDPLIHAGSGEATGWSPAEDGAPERDAGWTVPPLANGERPNIVLIMTDDLDVELGSLKYMPKLRRYLQEEGVTFRHGYVTTPLCCPSRSSYLTGMFIHNHQVYTNRDNCSSTLWQNTHERRTYAAYLQQAGYRTGYFGKYMNRYDGEHIPAGWDHWSSLILNSKYYNYSMNVNGRRIYKGWTYPQDYLPSVIVNDSLAYFRSVRRASRDPVLMVLSFPAPHGPEDAAPQYTHLFHNVTDHHTPSYDFAPNADKQWFLRHVGKMDAVERTFTDLLMTKRLQTLQSVDDAIENVYNRLAEAGELNSTYILFTSDHGYHLGQFGVAKGKSYPFQFDIRVPFIVRGPGVRAGSRSSSAVLNVDVAPSLLAMGGVAAPAQMDGRSFLPLLAATDAGPRAAPPPWPATFLLEGAGKRPEQRLRRRLQQGAVRPGDRNVLYVSALQRLQEACTQPEYRSPCKTYQKWACYHDGRRWRLQKCRRQRRRQQMCACRGGVVQGTRRIRAQERRDQLRFLKHHTNTDVRGMRMRFVKELREAHPSLALRSNASADGGLGDSAGMASAAAQAAGGPVDSLVKQFVQEEDSSNVDDNIHRIGLELLILQSHVNTMGRCAVDNSTCAAADLRTRQRTVRQQMRHLKRLLRELKRIQRFLTHSSAREALPWLPAHALASGRRAAGRRLTFHAADFDDYSDVTDTDDVTTASSATQLEVVRSDDVAFCPCRPMDDRAERQWVREYTKQARRAERAQRRHERRRQKRRKQRKKALLASQNCDFEGLNCFVQDSEHWKTPPFWTLPPVCICVGAANGTFDCVRHVDAGAAEDWLYCRFVTGFLSYYDLTVDPYQLHNLAPTLSSERLSTLDSQLAAMQGCVGPEQCRPLPVVAAVTGTGSSSGGGDSSSGTAAADTAITLPGVEQPAAGPTLRPTSLTAVPLLSVTLPSLPATAAAAPGSVSHRRRGRDRGQRSRRRRRRDKQRQRHLRRLNERARHLEWMRRLERKQAHDSQPSRN